jgi:hypothetical protein
LRIRQAALREGGGARQGFVDVQVVIQSTVPRSNVGQPETDVLNLPLDGNVELLDLAVGRVDRVAGDALRRNCARA